MKYTGRVSRHYASAHLDRSLPCLALCQQWEAAFGLAHMARVARDADFKRRVSDPVFPRPGFGPLLQRTLASHWRGGAIPGQGLRALRCAGGTNGGSPGRLDSEASCKQNHQHGSQEQDHQGAVRDESHGCSPFRQKLPSLYHGCLRLRFDVPASQPSLEKPLQVAGTAPLFVQFATPRPDAQRWNGKSLVPGVV